MTSGGMGHKSDRTRIERHLAFKKYSPVFHEYIKGKPGLVMPGAGFIGVVNASDKKDRDKVNWTLAEDELAKLRINFSIRYPYRYWFTVRAVWEQYISKGFIFGRCLIFADTTLRFMHVGSHGTWDQPWSYRNILRWGLANIFWNKSETYLHPVAVMSNWRRDRDINVYPRSGSQFKLLSGGIGSACGGVGTLSQGMNLNTVDYCLGKRCNGQREREKNQCGIGIFAVADKDYKLLDFSEQFSNADDELNWRWFPLAIVGIIFVCWGMIVFYTKSMTLGMITFLVGWVCGQIGFIRWFN